MKKNLKLICWNVNGIRAWTKKGCFDWFLKENPDFFCIQETKAHPEQLVAEVLNPIGYTSYFDHSKTKKGYSGVAVYTKDKPDKVDYEIIVDSIGGQKNTKKLSDPEGRFMALHYKSFVLINCYFPNGGGEPHRLEYKLHFYEAFLKYIKKIKTSGKKVIFCGDLNVAHSEIDIARPKENSKCIGFLPIERSWVDRVISSGFVDTFRELHPNTKDAYSWWDMKSSARDRNVGWRIDYFFVDEDIIKDVKKAEILSDIYGSDHCPIALEINI